MSTASLLRHFVGDDAHIVPNEKLPPSFASQNPPSRLPPRSVLLSLRSEVATGNPHPLEGGESLSVGLRIDFPYNRNALTAV